jgi:hypothetical protein
VFQRVVLRLRRDNEGEAEGVRVREKKWADLSEELAEREKKVKKENTALAVKVEKKEKERERIENVERKLETEMELVEIETEWLKKDRTEGLAKKEERVIEETEGLKGTLEKMNVQKAKDGVTARLGDVLKASEMKRKSTKRSLPSGAL